MSNLQKVVENSAFVNEDRHRSQMATLINALIDGKNNASGTFTLDANQASTTVSDNLFKAEMVPLWLPLTANAAAEIGAGGMYVSARTDGSFTITHANNANADRDFAYLRLG